MTVLFQEPVHYEATIKENIGIGDLNHMQNEDRIREAAESAGAEKFVQNFPEGYDTVLGKWFSSGTEISVGEWQKISLARAFFRKAPLLLLDEPTSAMDSWAEIDWMHRLRNIVKNQTVVLITHRFTTAMRADVIYVMEEGQIIEEGNHSDLLSKGGRYAESWEKQMQQIP